VAYAIADEAIDHATAWIGHEAAGGRGPYDDLGSVPHAAQGKLGAAALEQVVEAYAGPDSYLRRLLDGQRDDETTEAFHTEVLRLLDTVRVLTAHRQGALGVSGLNKAIQEAVADHLKLGRRVRDGGAARYWLGRPILVSENNHELGIMNGDVGVVVNQAQAAHGLVVAFPGADEGSVIYLSPAQLSAHETVFAMTVHKSQGSEFAHTVLVLPSRSSPLLTRELIYTGLTRAKARITVCGDVEVLRAALNRTVGRASGLGSLLWPA
jgi:exodeoxyribonuclease V alpha subunit